MNWIYILKSLKDNKLYVGSTSDIGERVKAHNAGKVRSTKTRRPLEIIYKKAYGTKTEARKRENFLKSGQGRKWIKENMRLWKGG